jgi:polyferredoxin
MSVPPAQRDIVVYLVKHLICGAVGASVLGALLLWFDFAKLATLIFASPDKLMFLLMLFAGLFLTFGSIAVALGVMQLGEEGPEA